MLYVENIHHAFGSHRVLQGVSFTLDASSITGLIGPSGSGKSVLMKILCGVMPADVGAVRHDLDCNSEVSLMFQEGALFDSLTVFDNIAFPLVDGNVPSDGLSREKLEEVHAQVEEILGHVGLKKAAYKLPAQLSGGMRRRVSLARALVAKPKIAFLDDPTCGLDPVASSVIMDLIAHLHAEYKPTLVLASHDLRRLLPIVEDVYALFDGELRYAGSVEKVGLEADSQVIDFISCRYDLSSGESASQ